MQSATGDNPGGIVFEVSRHKGGYVIALSSSELASYETASTVEWIVTNGLGGYASGTVAGSHTRRYHGYLIAALQPPVARTLLLSKLDETLRTRRGSIPLYANAWTGGAAEYANLLYLTGFWLEGTTPVWRFEHQSTVVEKRIWMQQGANTTYIHYTLVESPEPVTLDIKALANHRDHHAETNSNNWEMTVSPVGNGVRVDAFYEAIPLHILTSEGTVQTNHEWYLNYSHAVERYRGQPDSDDHLHVATFSAQLDVGESLTVVGTAEAEMPSLDGAAALEARRVYEQGLIEQAPLSELTPDIEQLILAADQVIVQRPTERDPDGQTVIAGYHWFADWGRDTMIALPGLTLATGRPEVAERILRTFAGFIDQGMLPNRFPDGGEEPEYNTVDATLWFFEALRAYHAATGDEALLRDLFPVLEDVIAWHERGTRYNIHVDPADGLLYAGVPGKQLTWMDAKVDEWVVTPRIGKPVEVNALWFNALRIMGDFARYLDMDATPYLERAERVRESFQKFWNDNLGYLYDVLDAPNGTGGTYHDDSIRPNQLFAASLPHSPITPHQQEEVLAICRDHLLTPRGLRSLTPFDREYVPVYGGDRRARDGAYHQGTVWGWLIGPFVGAHLKAHGDYEAARRILEPVLDNLTEHAVGTLSEIFDGQSPHRPRGAVAQAWTVAEVLRIWWLTSG